MGAGYVQAYLRRQGIATIALTAGGQLKLSDLADIIISAAAPIVGFTCYDSNYYLSKLLAESIKKQRPDIKIIMGGPSATFSDRLIMGDTLAVDVCVRGEGEYTMAELIPRLKCNEKPAGICGITYRDSGDIIREDERKRGGQLDKFPSPYLTGIFPINKDTLADIGRMGVSTSRGCPYHCTYCNFAAMSGHTIRHYPVDIVLGELERINTAACRYLPAGQKLRLAIQDDAFSINLKRAKDICKGIIRRNIERLSLSCETRADRIDRELLQLMQQAGFTHINFGLESAVPRILRIIKKVGTDLAQNKDYSAEENFLRQTKQAINWCNKIGLKSTVSIISGLPGESFKDGLATLDFVKGLGVTEYLHNRLQLHAGTQLFEKQAKYGISAAPSIWGLPYETKCSYNTKQIPVADNKKLCDSGNVMQELHYLFNIQRLLSIAGKGDRPADILLKQVEGISAELLGWLGGFISPMVKIAVINDDPLLFKRKESLQNIVNTDSPVLSFSRLVSAEKLVYPEKRTPPSNAVDLRWKPVILGLEAEESPPAIASRFFTPLRYIQNDNLLKSTALSQWGEEQSSHTFSGEYLWRHGIMQDKPYYETHLHRFYFVPFSRLGKLRGIISEDNYSKAVVFLSLQEDEDIAALDKAAGLVAKSGFSGLPAELVKFYCVFINECCWRMQSCGISGGNLSRLIIDKKNQLSCCLHGKLIGKVGDDIGVIKKRLIAYRGAELARRNCNQCELYKTCAKCIFPPVAASVYCELMRRRYGITGLIKTMPYIRAAWLHKNLPEGIHEAILGALGIKDKNRLDLLARLIS